MTYIYYNYSSYNNINQYFANPLVLPAAVRDPRPIVIAIAAAVAILNTIDIMIAVTITICNNLTAITSIYSFIECIITG